MEAQSLGRITERPRHSVIAAYAATCDTRSVWVTSRGRSFSINVLASTALFVLTSCGGRSPLEPGEVVELEPPVSLGGRPSTPSQPPVEPMQPMQPVRPCEAVNLTIDELRPAVTLLVDQSGSMRSGYPSRDSAESRWSLVHKALLDPATGVVPKLQHGIQFGLIFYTSHNGFSGGTCPELREVPAATTNFAAISALYESSYPEDDTPTGAAIAAVVQRLLATPRKGPEVILLVTDGEADTCEQPDPQGGQNEAILAAQAAFTAGIDFYVLGVSSDISGVNLQQLANAGRGQRLDAVWGRDPEAAQPFQASDSVQGLSAQLLGILEGLPLCEVELDRDVDADELSRGSVLLDGQPLAYGSADGFRLKDSRHLEVVGRGCEALRGGGKRLAVSISCD